MIGRKLAHYEITAKIGEGGMGEVYRARDVKLDRDVALKLISAEFRGDPERLARFEREARTLAALQHPNIASIYGFEEVDGHPFLVMELVEGEDLAERLTRGPLEVGEARAIARQVARGLEEAHDRGIVHRDLKPANVKLTPEGKVKVLDFGLARALIDDPSAENMQHSPTITARMTQAGVILGTAAYMSPEQARGLVVDRRADIWAFGCVLYEMLTGCAPFAGDTVTDMLADIVKSEPAWSDLPADTPASLRTLLWRCLRKDPQDRLRDIGDARLELSDTDLRTTGVIPVVDLPEQAAAAATGTRRAWMLPTLIAGLLGLAIGFFVARSVGDAAQVPDPVVSRLAIRSIDHRPFALGALWSGLTVTRDGRAIVYSVSASDSFSGEGVQIGVRALDSAQTVLVPGTESGVGPFLSPDDQWIGYFDFMTEKLERVAMSGGQPSEIAPAGNFTGGFWAADGSIYYTTASGGGLYRVPESGGEPELILPLDEPDEVMFTRPTLIEEEGMALFTVEYFDRQRPSVLVSLDLESGERRDLFPADLLIGRLPSGAWLYLDDDRLMARRIDPRGGDAPTAAGVALEDDIGAHTVVSRNGTLAYLDRKAGDARFGRVVFIDGEGRAGNAVEEPLENVRYPRVSPDGTKLAITVGPGMKGMLWVHDLVGSSPPVNLTFDGHNIFPVWSPDGRQIAFKRSAAGDSSDGTLAIVRADGSTLTPRTLDEESILGDVLPGSWSTDDRLVFSRSEPGAGSFDIWEVPVDSPAEGRTVVETRFDEGATSMLSPDERWLAYSSNRSGTPEIWVQGYPEGPSLPVTSGGAQQPVWSRDGKKLYYQTTGAIMVVDVDYNGPRITFSKPRVAYQGAFLASQAWTPRTYDVHPDGRLLLIQPVEYDDGRDDIIVVQNWFEEIRDLAP